VKSTRTHSLATSIRTSGAVEWVLSGASACLVFVRKGSWIHTSNSVSIPLRRIEIKPRPK
jgi:hypothetical protein